MCGYCCGATPIEKRGEGHRNCSENCYNAPRAAKVARLRAQLAEANAEVQRLRERVEALEAMPSAVKLGHVDGVCDACGCELKEDGNCPWCS